LSSGQDGILRIGIAGLGGMGTVHARNALAVEGGMLVAVASTRHDRGAEVARELGVRRCSYDDLFASDEIDAIIIAARSIDHSRVAIDALRGGKHVLLEKPGATNLADHDALLAEAERRPEQIIQVGYHRHYDARFVEAARLVHDGAIGRPLIVITTSRDVRTPEPEDPLPSGGFLIDMASHDYDTACWMLGQEPERVHVERQVSVYPELQALGDLDNAAVTIRFDAGGIAMTHVSRTCPWGHDVRLEVVGDQGSVFVGTDASWPGVSVVTHADAHRFPTDYRDLFADAYISELQAFVHASAGVGPRGPGLVEDRRAVATGIAARAAAVRRETLEVGRDWSWGGQPVSS
jgi:myo-inositol 2-dehydrogenase/D-chiro-inositol 1-dehydrogenase